jgi:hypothetical protein
MKYIVGKLNNPRPDDEEYELLAEAESQAMHNSIDDNVWGVWDEDGDLLSIAYQRELFSK